MQAIANEKNGIVIAHYHPEGKIPVYMINFINHARNHYTKDIVLVSTKISIKSRKSLAPYCKIISRDNFGYDFWSYKIGLEELQSNCSYDRLLIMNSSFIIIDPEKFLAAVLKRPQTGQLVGLTKSFDFSEHLQSFCILFDGPQVISSEAMKSWWSDMTPISDRDEVIQKYEIGMSRHFQSKGFSLVSIYQPTAREKTMAIMRAVVQSGTYLAIPDESESCPIDLKQAKTLNPTHFLWDQLFFRYGIVKLDFIRKSLYGWQFQSLLQKPDWRSTQVPAIAKDAYY
ncbi:rhamnan synthesis F family protein [Ottowia testudinis]|uniref:Rhamnan synthesis protein F n=1 Tax=Ottowia testudinis TaxID=2816950 RepID=A0A975CLM9_9BURK|nr:rhamnan synthesis F family protein [Ottowia testudinis]QTD45763.1 hypothetical protein J1M35_02255 [Ottowia testudinis]